MGRKRKFLSEFKPKKPVKVNFDSVEFVDDSDEVSKLAEKQKQSCEVFSFFPDPASSTGSPSSLEDFPTSEDELSLESIGYSNVDGGRTEGKGQPPSSHLSQSDDEQLNNREVVVDKNGLPRQAGAMLPEGEFIKRFKKRAEESLFIFAKGVLNLFFLTPHFHKAICNWLQKCPPYRKLLLMPREHCKTGLTSNSLPLHILIQPASSNIYFPGLEGSECRLLLCGETETMAKKNLRVIQNTFEDNKLFRAFWPHRCWPSRRDAKAWSSEQIIIPRNNEWPDPTIRAVGVGGAITGSRPNVLIKDDLVSFKAANSETVMDEAIDWHKASRALLDKYEVESGLSSLEFTAGTKWAVFDLYSTMIDDPSVELSPDSFRGIIKNGKILWPEKYSQADVEQLQREHGSNFYLLYLNSAADPELTDFDISLIRDFEFINGQIIFEENEDDERLKKKVDMKLKRLNGEVPPTNIKRGVALNDLIMRRIMDGGGGMRFRGI